MADPNVNTVFTAQDKMSATVKKVRGELAGFQKSVGGVKGAIPIFDKLGAATGGLINPTTLAIGAAAALSAGLVDATRRAAEEQVNIAKLDASLRANIAGWDGNTKAIESTIAVRERMAFSDDELRGSLALLVAATHDTTKAFQIQRTAMDLARFKGISLEEATTALVKVEGGQYRALKGLGIVLRDGADATEALAAVQKVAMGQAEAYATTLEGKLDTLAIRWDDLSESVGRVAVGPLTEIVTKLDLAAQGVAVLSGELDLAKLPLEEQIALLNEVKTAYPQYTSAVDDAIATLQRAATGQATLNRQMERGKDGGADLAATTDDVRTSFHRAYNAADALAGSLKDVKDNAEDAASALAGAIYGPTILRGRLAELQQEVIDTTTAIKKLSEKKDLTAEDRRELASLRGDLAETNSDILVTVTKLKLVGGTLPKEAEQSLSRLGGQLQNDTAAAKKLAHWLWLIGQSGQAEGVGPHTGPEPRASGGPVLPGHTYDVGEQGRERLVMAPNGGGFVFPNGGGSSGGGGGSMVAVPIILQLDGETVYRSVERRLVRDLRTAPSMTR